MTDKVFEINYAGHRVRYSFNYSATRFQFRKYIKKVDTDEYDIRADQELLDKARLLLPDNSSDSYIEYRTLIGLTAKELLKYECSIFHAVSFVYKGSVWLLTAPSGTGKTTQYLNWQRLFPEEITMISGDMPVLERKDNAILVHPTSWNGKENIGNMISAPLKGIIYLCQDDHNVIEEISVKDGVTLLLKQFMVLPDDEKEVSVLSSLIDCIFRHYPVWCYHNSGDDCSTILLKQTIDEYLEAK